VVPEELQPVLRGLGLKAAVQHQVVVVVPEAIPEELQPIVVLVVAVVMAAAAAVLNMAYPDVRVPLAAAERL
jgi:hypothetical protein